MSKTILLYRPVGLPEAELIKASGYRAFPPRLPEQPIFYPVLNFAYAEQIARDWNTRFDSHVGIVTRFEVDAEYVARFDIRTVGAESVHQELWVPADELEEFNRHIIGRICFVAVYYGPLYQGLAIHIEEDGETNCCVSPET